MSEAVEWKSGTRNMEAESVRSRNLTRGIWRLRVSEAAERNSDTKNMESESDRSRNLARGI